MTQAEIEAAIPHRAPMLLVDEIVSLQDHEIVCRKRFRPDEYFVQGHYPGHPLVPGVILCESAMQAGAILLARIIQGLDGVPVVTRMRDVRFKRQVRPGDEVEIRAQLVEHVGGAYFLTAQVHTGGHLAARLEFACMLVPAVAP